MNITPVSYRQACDILECKYTTLINAAERGVFTKLPVTGHEQRIIKEQVELFIGKKQLKLAALSRDDYRRWEEIEQEVNKKGVEVQEQQVKTPVRTKLDDLIDWLKSPSPNQDARGFL